MCVRLHKFIEIKSNWRSSKMVWVSPPLNRSLSPYRRYTLLSPPPSSYPSWLETLKPAVYNRINITQAQQANRSLCCVTIISDRIQQVRNIEALYCCFLFCWRLLFNLTQTLHSLCQCVYCGFTQQGSWLHAICKRKWNFFPQICQKHYSFQAYSSFMLHRCMYTNFSVQSVYVFKCMRINTDCVGPWQLSFLRFIGAETDLRMVLFTSLSHEHLIFHMFSLLRQILLLLYVTVTFHLFNGIFIRKLLLPKIDEAIGEG